MLTTEVFLSLPRITAMEYGDLDFSLIPTVRAEKKFGLFPSKTGFRKPVLLGKSRNSLLTHFKNNGSNSNVHYR
jgi:hypothetical protein